MANPNFTQFPPLSTTPLVSGVIIFFNNQPFLAEAIESVLAQTYERWELLLVDDGSTDDSTQIAQQYAQADPHRVHYLEHPNHQNRGMNASRNLGIQHAKGELIALLDGDDVWLPHKLAEQVAVYQQHPEAGMVYGRTQSWYSWTDNPEDQDRDHFTQLGVPPNTLVQPPKLALNLLEGYDQTPTTCNAILRRDVFDIIGGFDENYRDNFQDQAFFIKVELHFPVFIADNWWAQYRKHQASSYMKFATAARQNPGLHYSKRLKFLKWVKTYLTSQGYQTPEVWQCLRKKQKLNNKKLWLNRLPIHKLWIQILDIVMNLGRQALPNTWRDWLWRVVGRRLYVR